MRHFSACALALALTTSPLAAQDSSDDISEGMDLMQQGTRLLMQGLMNELGPALSELEGKITNLNMYHAPEILPNGDIVIRKRTPEVPDFDAPAEGEIDL